MADSHFQAFELTPLAQIFKWERDERDFVGRYSSYWKVWSETQRKHAAFFLILSSAATDDDYVCVEKNSRIFGHFRKSVKQLLNKLRQQRSVGTVADSIEQSKLFIRITKVQHELDSDNYTSFVGGMLRIPREEMYDFAVRLRRGITSFVEAGDFSQEGINLTVDALDALQWLLVKIYHVDKHLFLQKLSKSFADNSTEYQLDITPPKSRVADATKVVGSTIFEIVSNLSKGS